MGTIFVNPYRFSGGGGGGGGSSQPVVYIGRGTSSAGTGSITLSGSFVDPTDGTTAVGTLTNDIFLAIFETNDSDTIATPTGWAHVTGSPVTGSGIDDTRVHVFWKRCASNGEVPSISVADPGDHWIGQIFAFRYAKASGNPWNQINSGNAAGSSSYSITGFTTTVNNCLVVICASQGEDGFLGVFSGWTNSNLTSFAEAAEQVTSLGDGGGIVMASGLKATAGAIGTTTVNNSGASHVAHVILALEPANP